MRFRKFTIISILFALLASAQAQEKGERIFTEFIDSTFSMIQDQWLYIEKVDIEAYRRKADSLKKYIESTEELMPLFQQMFDEAQDNHSFFWVNNKKYSSHFGQLSEDDIRKPLIDALENGEGIYKAEIIDNIGYLRIPQDNTSDNPKAMQSHAQNFHQQICEIYEQNPEGWIIDLRLNTGGNMYPMISSISAIVGEGDFAYQVDRNGNKTNWSIKGLAVMQGKDTITSLIKTCLPDLSSERLVVLTSQMTGSSGEITALAVSKRPNTYFIGEQTAGFMTSNELIRLPQEVFLLLAHAHEANSDGELVNKITPDLEMIEGDSFSNLLEDTKVQKAISWLKNRD
ncbi:MAG: S41 family peptidase [Cytophagia bacterium]|nr:S41 family peptidase [Cytophagia bacterium]